MPGAHYPSSQKCMQKCMQSALAHVALHSRRCASYLGTWNTIPGYHSQIFSYRPPSSCPAYPTQTATPNHITDGLSSSYLDTRSLRSQSCQRIRTSEIAFCYRPASCPHCAYHGRRRRDRRTDQGTGIKRWHRWGFSYRIHL